MQFNPEQLDAALLASFDLMSRVLLQTTYIVVGEAARCIHENRGLDCDALDFVIDKRHITKEVLSTLKEWATPDITEEGFTYEHNEVPLRFRFITETYPFFKYADTKLYGPEDYKIPNGWDEYWQHKDEIV